MSAPRNSSQGTGSAPVPARPYEPNDSPFGDFVRHFQAEGPDALRSYGPEDRSEYESCVRAQLGLPVYAGDAVLTALLAALEARTAADAADALLEAEAGAQEDAYLASLSPAERARYDAWNTPPDAEPDEPWMGYTPGEDARPRGGRRGR